jgi:hypothetical protein
MVLCLTSMGFCAGKGTNWGGVDTAQTLNKVFNDKAEFASLSASGTVNLANIVTPTGAAGTFKVAGTQALVSSGTVSIVAGAGNSVLTLTPTQSSTVNVSGGTGGESMALKVVPLERGRML